jgi:hypothetical protein
VGVGLSSGDDGISESCDIADDAHEVADDRTSEFAGLRGLLLGDGVYIAPP